MSIKAVVFDLDGTLVGFNLDYRSLRAEVRGYLAKQGVPASVLSLQENIFEMLKKAELFLRNTRKPTTTIEKLRGEVLSIAEKYELDAAMSTGLLSGALETLKTLKRMGLKLGICTTDSEKAATYILQRFRIADFFDAVVTRDKVKQVKPHPEHLQAVLDALGVKPEESMVVGDSVMDMQCAQELKAIAVGLPTGISTKQQLTQQGANYIVTSITDVPVLIERINKAQMQQ
ncbi:MAG: HAD family hydrolase [Candidatus Bathyarchaeia archaeon]|jgi:HAD superfamily hydrolase (TIGR01549 family)